MLITEKNQYSKSGYHPDSTLKTHFHISKIRKSDKIVKKGKSVENLGGVNRGPLRINRGSTGDQQGINRGIVNKASNQSNSVNTNQYQNS